MKEMSILILMLKISLETKMEICMHLEMADRLSMGTEEDEVLLNYCVMVSLHPSGKKQLDGATATVSQNTTLKTGT